MSNAAHPVPFIRCQADDARQVGRVQGEGLREQIEAASEALAGLDVFRVNQPWWMPYSWFRYWAEWRARGLLQAPVEQSFPEIAARLEGMAEASAVRLETLYLFHALESLMSQPQSSVEVPGPALAACTAVGVRASRAADGGPLVHHNFDNLPVVLPLSVVRERSGDDRYRCLEFTLAPLGGSIDGVNEAGLAITYNYACTVQPGEPAAPVSMAISKALGRCANVREAVRLLRSQPLCGGAILMLADAGGDLARLEIAGTRRRVMRPRGRTDLLFHSNRYTTRAMREVEIDCAAVFSDAAPEGLRRCRVLESAERRDERLEQLFAAPQAYDADQLAVLMGDHGASGSGDANTVCMHGSYWTTTAALQLMPAERRMRVSLGHACEARYIDFAL